ncbi:Hypothetical_protein [Hexamita inflata]|uniref:Hypothetical_protein n=1 Tax=Hexamita inflata TaxID=28002 RepID=A0ABP1GWK3_9EUKA
MRQVMNEVNIRIPNFPRSQAEHPRSTKSTKPPNKHQPKLRYKHKPKTNRPRMPQITIRLGRPTLSNSNSTVTEMIDFNYVTQLHKYAQKGALTKHEELNTAGTNQRRPSEVFKLKNFGAQLKEKLIQRK